MGVTFGEVLARRRMCRDFQAAPVSPDVVGRIVTAATRAPAAGNTHGFHVLALTGDDTRTYWDTTMPEPRRSSFRWPGLLAAPVLLLPYVEPDAYVRRYAEADKAVSGLGSDAEDWPVPYWFVDGGAALMAMLLAIEDEGLGGLLFGQFHHERALRAALGVPERYRALGTLAVGRPRQGGDHRSASVGRGRPEVSDVLHTGGW